jgi:mannose-6-phosphate isomerase
VTSSRLDAPLRFRPVYQGVVWGGRRMERHRSDLPPGPVGESWDLADHPRGMSVVADGPHAGMTLRALTAEHGTALVGAGFTGGDFPLLVKLIDANDRLSVQVHPDDRLAVELGVGARGKTECWLLVSEGELYSGTVPGTDRARFEHALAGGRVSDLLAKHRVADGDFVFIAARTVHAIGAGCLLYEVQQTCDTTFRVDDWGRVGLDGKPRPLHVRESLATIDFAARAEPTRPAERPHPAGGTVRSLAACPYFLVEERRADHTSGGGGGVCQIVTCLEGHGRIATAGGAASVGPWQTLLIPADAGPWTATADPGDIAGLRLLVATPVLDGPGGAH